MANITEHLNRIKAAIYGEEVRGSIHDAIQAINEESSVAYQAAATAQNSAQASAAAAAESASSAKQYNDRITAIIEDGEEAAAEVAEGAIDQINTYTSELIGEVRDCKASAEASKNSAKVSENRAREYAQDVVDQTIDLETIPPADNITEASLFLVSIGGENKTVTGKQLADYAWSENEDRVTTIGENSVTQTMDSGTVLTEFSTDQNGNDVITTKRIPNTGIWDYVTETIISVNAIGEDVITTTHRIEEKEA